MMDQPVIDGIGYAAAVLVLATFCMRSMAALRSVAVASNVAFILYGYLGSFPPVLLLHILLLPINACLLLHLCTSRHGDRQVARGMPQGARRRPQALILLRRAATGEGDHAKHGGGET